MNFNGLPTYTTDNPRTLNTELQRQNLAVDAALKDLERERAARPTVRFVNKDTGAALDEMIVCDTSTNAVTVTLPLSSTSNAGRRIGVVMAASGTAFVKASGTNLVAGIPLYTMSTVGQLIEFYDDGQGRWWRT